MLNQHTITVFRCNPVVEPPKPPLDVYGDLQCSVCLGATYTSQITATGGQAPYTYILIDGTLPPGLTLNGYTGAITGTPTEFGSWSFTVRVVDSLSATTDPELTINVLVITSGENELPPFAEGVPYSFQLGAIGGSGSYIWVVSSGAFPDGITMTGSGLITGTPTGGLTGSVELEVFDASCTNDVHVDEDGNIIDYDGNILGDYEGQPVGEYP